MNRYVADTHGLHWYFIGSPRLGPQARRAFEEGAAGNAVIYVSVVTLAELFYLNQKANQLDVFRAEVVRLQSSKQFVLVPLEADDVLDFEKDAAVPEMHDRAVVGLARRNGATCLTRDPEIVNSGIVPTLW